MKYSEDELFDMLKRADAAKDNEAASVIADEIHKLRALNVSEKGEMAVSADVHSPEKLQNKYIPDWIEKPLAEGLSETFSANYGTIIDSLMPSWATGRLLVPNKETGELDFYQPTDQWLGLEKGQWDDMSVEDRRNAIAAKTKKDLDEKFGDVDKASASYSLFKLTGMITDPSTLIPISKAPIAMGGKELVKEGVKSMAVKGSALGAADMGAWSLIQEGKITPENLALGIGFGLVPAGIVGGYQGIKATKKKLTSSIRTALTPKEQRAAAAKLMDFDKQFQVMRTKYDNHTVAYMKTLEQLNLTDNALNHWIKTSTQAAKRKATSLDRIIEPVSDRIRKISPTLHYKLVGMERNILETSHTAMSMGDTFLKGTKKIISDNPVTGHALKKAMLNGKGDDIVKIVQENLGEKGLKEYESYRQSMKDMWKLVSKSRENLIGKEVEHYTHRAVKDYKMIKDWMIRHGAKEDLERIKKLIAKQFKDRTPTDDEMNAFFSRYLDGVYDATKSNIKPGAARGRRLKVVPDELVDAFHDPEVATHSYIRSMTEDAYKKQLFGKDIVSKHADNLDDSIAEYTQKEYAAGRLDGDDIDELKHLLKLRFHDGLKKPHELIQKFKDYSYSMLLGNPISAATQIGDVFLATWKVGFRESMEGVAKAVTGRGIKPKDWGLMDSMLEEMVSTGKSKKWLRRSLSFGGFRGVDRIGKATLMNGSLSKYQRMAAKNPAKFKKLWGEALGKDTERVLQELRSGKLTGDVKTLVFADLADVQPITLLEMPEKYLKYPNGRIAYMLRTFQLKYLNLLRKNMVAGFKKGNRTKALASGFGLMTMFTAGGITSDLIKHAMLSRDPNVDEVVVDNILANTGIFGSRYAAGKVFAKRGEVYGAGNPLMTVAGQLLPPVGAFDPFAYAFVQVAQGNDITLEDKARMMAKLPVVGRIVENYGFGGKERFADRKFRESMEIDIDL